MCLLNRAEPPGLPSDETLPYRVAEQLRSRSVLLDWKGLWKILFPLDSHEDIPGPGTWTRSEFLDGQLIL
jgi:hypothetical protein